MNVLASVAPLQGDHPLLFPFAGMLHRAVQPAHPVCKGAQWRRYVGAEIQPTFYSLCRMAGRGCVAPEEEALF